MARKKFWTRKRDKILRERFADCDMAELAAEIGVSTLAVKSRAQKLGLRRNTTRREWTAEQNAYLTEHYATTPTEECAEKTGHPASSIYKQAKKLGLTKCPEFVIKILREKSGHPNSVAHQFKKGQSSANKGRRMAGYPKDTTCRSVTATARTARLRTFILSAVRMPPASRYSVRPPKRVPPVLRRHRRSATRASAGTRLGYTGA